MAEMLSVCALILMIYFCVADEEILKLTAECPPTVSGKPILKLRTDVNGYAQAKCKNGLKAFTPDQDEVEHLLVGSFDQNYVGEDCQIYKKSEINTYTVEVEYGMGERNAEGIFQSNVETVSCAYDEFGNAVSNKEIVGDAILAAEEFQNLIGPEADVEFHLEVLDVLDATINNEKIDIGRKIRLYTTKSSGALSGFRAERCVAQNSDNRYPILVAGCGDGLIIPQSMGFTTRDNEVYSPYFKAFRLRGSGNLQFHCDFILCSGSCDGDSCTNDNRKKRSLASNDVLNKTMVSVESGPIWVGSKPDDRLETDIFVNEWTEESPIKQEEPSVKAEDSESVLTLPTIAGIDSCTNDNRKKRSLASNDVLNKTMVSVESGPIWVGSKPDDRLETDIFVNEWTEESPIKQEEPSVKAEDSESVLTLPTIAGIVLVFMCLIATILTVYFVLTTPRSRFVGICSNNV